MNPMLRRILSHREEGRGAGLNVLQSHESHAAAHSVPQRCGTGGIQNLLQSHESHAAAHSVPRVGLNTHDPPIFFGVGNTLRERHLREGLRDGDVGEFFLEKGRGGGKLG